MTIQIPIKQNNLKIILTNLLPTYDAQTQLQLYAKECGYRTDSHRVSNILLEESPIEETYKAAASGKVLPLLVQTAQKKLHPNYSIKNANTILSETINTFKWELYLKNLESILDSARRTPSGPAKWFYAHITSQALIIKNKPLDDDMFWRQKSTDLLFAFLNLVDYIQTIHFTNNLKESLQKINPKNLSDWEKKGYERLLPTYPRIMNGTIYNTMIMALPKKDRIIISRIESDTFQN